MKQVKRTFIYPIFERFWHWSQAALIIVLGLSGFEVHGSYRLFGFGNAVSIHNTATEAGLPRLQAADFPIMATTGLLYMFSNTLGVPISPIAFLHVLGAFLLLSFFIVHLYMVLTTGRTPLAHLKPMITGWEELEEETGEAPQAAPQPSGD